MINQLSGYRRNLPSPAKSGRKLVTLLMALFSLATAVLFHNHLADQNQMIHFMKNVMMAGGLLQITYFGAGAFSLDAGSPREALRETALRTR